MENNNLKEDLVILGLEERLLEDARIGEVIKAYRRKARIVHPDKAGKESTAAFQKLNNAYERLLAYLVNKCNSNEDESDEEEDEDEIFAKANFHNFNFPNEKEKSFVVQVENDLADAWSECFERKYGIPVINKQQMV